MSLFDNGTDVCVNNQITPTDLLARLPPINKTVLLYPILILAFDCLFWPDRYVLNFLQIVIKPAHLRHNKMNSANLATVSYFIHLYKNKTCLHLRLDIHWYSLPSCLDLTKRIHQLCWPALPTSSHLLVNSNSHPLHFSIVNQTFFYREINIECTTSRCHPVPHLQHPPPNCQGVASCPHIPQQHLLQCSHFSFFFHPWWRGLQYHHWPFLHLLWRHVLQGRPHLWLLWGR